MAENTVNTGEQAPAAEGPAQDRTFTQEDVDRIVKERLARAKSTPPADYAAHKPKAAEWDKAQEAAKSELERANERAAKADRALADAQAAIEHSELVAKVSQETGVPASLLHGATEEELAASASAISDFVKASAPGYPRDKGGAAGGRAVTVESIEAIKNPVERVRARAAHADLYRNR